MIAATTRRRVLPILLAASFGMPAFGEEPSASVRTAILVADAEKLYREGKFSQAVAVYDKASARAFSEGAIGRAFELSRTAAAVLQSQGEYAKAGDRLRRLALANAAHPEAADSHRAAIVCFAQCLKDTPGRAADYTDAMGEFLEQWPENPSCDEVRWWLAKWLLGSGQPRQAIKRLLAVPAESPHYTQAIGLLGDAGLEVLAQLKKGERSEERARAFVSRFTQGLQPMVTGDQNRWPSQWNESQRSAALSLARIHLAGGKANAPYAYRILSAAATGRPQAGEDWLAQAAPVLVAAAVTQGDQKGALEWMENLTAASAPRCEALVAELEAEAVNGPDPAAAGMLLLALTEQLAGSQPDWASRAQAIGQLAVGEHRDALRLLGPLHKQSPGDLLLTQALAQALAEQTDEESLLHALDLWTQVERVSAKNTPLWRRARAARIELLKATGDREQAEKLRRITELLTPRSTPPEPGAYAQ